jgi:hypothetical protein
LQWNNAEKQKKILKEAERVVNDFAIIQHVGADNEDKDLWRDRVNNLLGGKVDKLKRNDYFFSSRDEIEIWMKEQNISFNRIQDRKVEKFSNLFFERYDLDGEEKLKTENILGDKDYVIQTTWLIKSSKK